MLADHFGAPVKALVEVAGQPMLGWVGATLVAREDVRRIVILAQNAAALLDHPKTRWLRDEPLVTVRDCGDSVVEAIGGTLRAMPAGPAFDPFAYGSKPFSIISPPAGVMNARSFFSLIFREMKWAVPSPRPSSNQW